MKQYNDCPSEDASPHNHSRRKFLIRAGASALTMPFFVTASHAQPSVCPPPPPCDAPIPPPPPQPPACTLYTLTPPGSPTDANGCSTVPMVDTGQFLISGCCNDTICGYNSAVGSDGTVGINVSGVRHYCAQDDCVPVSIPPRPNSAFLCITIYPSVDNLLNHCYDDALSQFFESGFKGRDMLSCWHELANVSGKTDRTGHLITASDAQNMQNYIMEFMQKGGYTAPRFGAIEAPADTDGGRDPGGIIRCTPFMARGLQFYGQDLYYTNYPDPTVPLGLWENAFAGGSGYGAADATISVCECNVSEEFPDWRSIRADYFYATAHWVYKQTNKSTRSFLTFWRYDDSLGESGPWIAGNTQTIDVLKNIGLGKFGQQPNSVKVESKDGNVCWAPGE